MVRRIDPFHVFVRVEPVEASWNLGVQIAISMRSERRWFLGSDHNFAASEAMHPKGGPKARGICAPTPKTPDSEFVLFLILASGTLMSPDAALSPRRATHLFLLRQNKVSQKKATLLSAKVFGVRARIRRAYGSPCGCDALHRSEIGV